MLKNIFTSLTIAAITVILFAPMTMFPSDVSAKSFGGGSRSFSSSSFSRSSIRSSSGSSSKSMFSTYKSKPSTTAKPSTPSSQKKFNTTATTNSHKFDGTKAKTGFTTVSSGKQTRQAKASLTAQRNKFKKPVVTSSGSKNASASTGTAYKQTYGNRAVYNKSSSYDRSTYYTRRNQYYGSYQPPVYVYNSSPSYGLWDTIFLFSLLSTMNNNDHASSFAYNHQNDSDYQEWRRDADKLAQDNAELRAQLAQLDAKSAKMTGARNVDYIPDGIDADIAMSEEVLSSQKPTLRVCVASSNGTYFRVTAGVLMQGINSVNIVPVTTEGTGQILEYLTEDKCDAAFAQGDGYWNYVESKKTTELPFERVSSPFKEAVHLICQESGPSSITKLSPNHKVWFPAKSGAAETWKNFIGEEENYKQVKTVFNTPSMKVSSYEEAITKVVSDRNSCAMYVGAPGASKFIQNVDDGAKISKLVLRDVDDGALDNTEDPSGSDVYDFRDITGYKNLNREGGCYGFCSGDIKTLFVNADFLVSNKWKETNKSSYSALAVDLMGVQPEIQTAVISQ